MAIQRVRVLNKGLPEGTLWEKNFILKSSLEQFRPVHDTRLHVQSLITTVYYCCMYSAFTCDTPVSFHKGLNCKYVTIKGK